MATTRSARGCPPRSSAGRLPASLLLHGTRGIGKQRLALWIAQSLVCARPASRRNAMRPLPGVPICARARTPGRALVLSSPTTRVGRHGQGCHERLCGRDRRARRARRGCTLLRRVSTASTSRPCARSCRWRASRRRWASRKVFIIGDAEQMVSQEGSDEAANALLKLLEEPPANTTIVLTSSEPGALLPTIRSRVVNVRVAPLHRARRRGVPSPIPS